METLLTFLLLTDLLPNVAWWLLLSDDE